MQEQQSLKRCVCCGCHGVHRNFCGLCKLASKLCKQCHYCTFHCVCAIGDEELLELYDGDEAPAVNNVFTGLPEQDVIAQRFAEAIRLCDELSALAEPRPPKQVKFADEEEQRVRFSHQIMLLSGNWPDKDGWMGFYYSDGTPVKYNPQWV